MGSGVGLKPDNSILLFKKWGGQPLGKSRACVYDAERGSGRKSMSIVQKVIKRGGIRPNPAKIGANQ